MKIATEVIHPPTLSDLAVYKYTSDSTPSCSHVLFAHATGFHGRCYDYIARRLIAKHDCTSFDFRGHGDSNIDLQWSVDWQGFGDDALEVAKTLKDGVIGVGHSMGGAALVMAALAEPQLFSALVLYEPIIFPPEIGKSRSNNDQPIALVEGARRRRSIFPSRAEAMRNYSAKPPLNIFDRETLEAYVDFGFKDCEIGVELKCRGEFEAQTYLMGAAHATWNQLGELRVPTWIVAGSYQPEQPSAIAPVIAKQIVGAKFVEWLDAGHFGPMQLPDRLAELICEVDTLITNTPGN